MIDRKIFKSDIEFYFSLYLEELKKAGFVQEWFYETSMYMLCLPYSRTYLYKGKRKTVEKTEHILHKSSITADFTILWSLKAKNIFYLEPTEPIECLIKEIPFRLHMEDSNEIVSLIETKGMSESRTSSSVSFPLKQKQLVKDQGVYVQKIKPYSAYGKGCLMENTFVPDEVLKHERYSKNGSYKPKGEKAVEYKKGQSKIKFKTRSLTDYLKMRNYDFG